MASSNPPAIANVRSNKKAKYCHVQAMSARFILSADDRPSRLVR